MLGLWSMVKIGLTMMPTIKMPEVANKVTAAYSRGLEE
jgi:hypothetical protein